MRRQVFIFIGCLFILRPGVNGQDYFNFEKENKLVSCVDGNLIYTFSVATKSTVSKIDRSKEYFWFQNFKLQHSQGAYNGKLLDGSYQLKTRDNKVLQEGIFQRGLKQGEWKEWTDNGKLLKAVTWNSGKMDGPFWEYDKNGKLVLHGYFKDEKLHGKITEYRLTGEPRVKEYKHGQFIDKERIAREKETKKKTKEGAKKRKNEEKQVDKQVEGIEKVDQPANSQDPITSEKKVAKKARKKKIRTKKEDSKLKKVQKSTEHKHEETKQKKLKNQRRKRNHKLSRIFNGRR